MDGPAAENGYPSDFEGRRITKSGIEIFLRAAQSGDVPLYKAFLQSLSDKSLNFKFFRTVGATDEFAKKMLEVDHLRQVMIFALVRGKAGETIVGMGRYHLNPRQDTAEVYFGVSDEYQNRGIGRELLSQLIGVAKKRALKGITAQVIVDNRPMLHLFRSFEGKEFRIERTLDAGVFCLDMEFL